MTSEPPVQGIFDVFNMKRVWILVLGLMSVQLAVHGQDATRKHSIGLYQTFTDYNVHLLEGETFVFDSALSHGTRLAYQRRLNRTWMLNTGITNGFINHQTLNNQYTKKAFAIGADAAIQFKLNNGALIREDALIGPYLSFGYRLEYVNQLRDFNVSPWLMHNQYALGTNIKMSSRTHLQFQFAVDQKLQGDFNTHMRYRIGITQSLGPLEDLWKTPVRAGDADQDGIIDAEDACPGLYGLARLSGCPDSVKATQDALVIDSLHSTITQLEQSEQYLAQSLDSIVNTLDSLINAVEQDGPLVSDLQEETTEEIEPEKPEDETFELPSTGDYYVIVISVRDLNTAKAFHQRVVNDFGKGFIMPQSNGFYRVGILAGKSFTQAKGVMDKVKLKGYHPVWIAKE